MAASDKQRLDLAVLNRGLAASRQRARALIMSGKIL
ncbi:MAG: S4 domain-containing protein, partial [Desulfobacterales bacterium]